MDGVRAVKSRAHPVSSVTLAPWLPTFAQVDVVGSGLGRYGRALFRGLGARQVFAGPQAVRADHADAKGAIIGHKEIATAPLAQEGPLPSRFAACPYLGIKIPSTTKTERPSNQ